MAIKKWGAGFITNTNRNMLTERFTIYQAAANAIGLGITIYQDAYDIIGRPMPDYVAFYLSDHRKKQEFWDSFNNIHTGSWPNTHAGNTPKLCICNSQVIFNFGCTCGGK